VVGQGEAPDKNKAQYGSMWQLENFLDERDGRDFFAASDAISIVPHDSISRQSWVDHNDGIVDHGAPAQTPKADQPGSKGCPQNTRGSR
jgi:hypothetical protein